MLDSKFYIGWQNDLASFTLASDVSVEAAYPLTNLQNEFKGEPTRWDMGSDSAIVITGTQATEFTANMFLMKGHNGSSDVTNRLRLYTDASYAGKLKLDTARPSSALDGAADYLTIPDKVLPAGDIDFYWTGNPTDPTPASAEMLVGQWDNAGTQRCMSINLDTTGYINLLLSANGTSSGGDSDSTVAPSFGAFTTSIKTSWNQTTGIATYYEYNNNSAGYDASINPADYDYLNDNNLWIQIGSTDDSGLTGALHNSTAVASAGAKATGGTPHDGAFTRAAIYVGGTIHLDFDIRRYITGTTMTSEPGETVTIVSAPPLTVNPSVIYTIIPWGESIAGINPWGNYYDPDSNLDVVYSIGFPTITYKSLRWEIAVPTDDPFEIDQATLCYGWTPEHNYNHGAVTTIEDDTRLKKMSSGGIRPSVHPARRAMDIEFAYLPDSERNVLMHILEVARLGGNLYVLANPNDTGFSKYLHSSIFKRMNNASFAQLVYGTSDMSLVLKEN